MGVGGGRGRGRGRGKIGLDEYRLDLFSLMRGQDIGLNEES